MREMFQLSEKSQAGLCQKHYDSKCTKSFIIIHTNLKFV